MRTCQSIRINDEYHCRSCSLRWSVDDPEPPDCGQIEDFKRAVRGGLGTDQGFLNSYRAAKDGE